MGINDIIATIDGVDDLELMIKYINDLLKEVDSLEIETQKKIDFIKNLLDKMDNKIKSEHTEITETINTLDDLICVAKKYGTSQKNENMLINTKILFDLINPLQELNKIIGMDNIKNQIIDQILTSMQCLYDDDTLFHTIITGPPGVGKTLLAKILGEIYLRMGLLKNSKFIFKIAKRSDLIGKYLGHTAIKTQDFIDNCDGGVMFIDEVYSLGNHEKRDNFSKECIDTINLNLTEKKNFVCIIAGYPNEIEECFFAFNEGLKRRFQFRYDIQDYTSTELSQIFIKKILDSEWKIDFEVGRLVKFIDNNKANFKYFGGDIDNLIINCKTVHSRRIFGKDKTLMRILTYDDIRKGYDNMMSFKNNKEITTKYLYMYN